MQVTNKRETGPDIVRFLAILFVVSVHFFLNTKFYETPIAGKSMYLQVFLQAIFMSCIPLFLMLTGYFNTKVDLSWKFFKKLLPILGVYAFYSILSIIYRRYHLGEVKGIKDWIIDILTFRADAYSWYVNMYIGLFLMSPFLNIIFNNLKSKRERQILLVVFLFISAVPNFLNGRFLNIMYFPTYWADFYPVGYYFVGSYIREYKPKIKKSYALGVLFLILLFETFFECYVPKGSVYITYMGPFGSLMRLVVAFFIFIIFYDVQIRNKILKGVITAGSMLSFDIYLASYISDKIVYEYVDKYIFTAQNRIVLWIIPIVLASFLMAFAAGFIRSRLSKLRLPGKNSIEGNKSISS